MLQIRNILISIGLILSFLNSNAQIWCHPGATWHYEHYNVAASLYTRHNYIKDTLMFSKNCNKITYYTQGFGMFGPVSYYGANLYTHVNGNVVYLLDQSTNNFDTLFNFGAGIGDTWSLAPNSVTNCANSKVNVLDTGHYTIQSQYLKWIYVQVNAVANFGSYSFNDTLIERIGCRNRYFYYFQDVCQTIWDQEKGGPLRCYSDNQIINYRYNYSAACNYYFSTGIEEQKNSALKIYPNPVLNEVYFENYSSNFIEVKIINVLGEEIKNKTFTKGKTSINISEIPSGIYYLQLSFDNNSRIINKKIIKQ